MIALPSPNFNQRQAEQIDMLVIHYTGMISAQAALDRLCDAKAEVSAHYVIDQDGTLYALVEESMRAWHAGKSYWRGQTDINSRSIGIELVNPGHEFGLSPYPGPQIQTLLKLSLTLLARHPIPKRNVVGHSDIAPARKQDPGELFPWSYLAQNGVGAWPQPHTETVLPSLEQAISSWGYDVSDTHAAIAAFQRHFRPQLINGLADEETHHLALGLMDQHI